MGFTDGRTFILLMPPYFDLHVILARLKSYGDISIAVSYTHLSDNDDGDNIMWLNILNTRSLNELFSLCHEIADKFTDRCV